MTKTLRVIDSFFIAEVGDVFSLNEDGTKYSLVKSEEFYKVADDSSSEVQSSYTSTFEISTSYAKKLIEEGYLEEETEKNDGKPFVNVFDEINSLIQKYNSELQNLATEDMPQCLRVEKETVLSNLVKVLNYLKNLKK